MLLKNLRNLLFIQYAGISSLASDGNGSESVIQKERENVTGQREQSLQHSEQILNHFKTLNLFI